MVSAEPLSVLTSCTVEVGDSAFPHGDEQPCRFSAARSTNPLQKSPDRTQF
jgi:hypothetical protein